MQMQSVTTLHMSMFKKKYKQWIEMQLKPFVNFEFPGHHSCQSECQLMSAANHWTPDKHSGSQSPLKHLYKGFRS